MSTLSSSSSSTGSHPPPPPNLPSWMTEESATVDALLAEIAKQSSASASSNPISNLISSISSSSSDNDKKITNIPNDDPDHPDNKIASSEEEDVHAFVATTVLQPLVNLIRSPVVLRRFLHKFVIARTGRIESAAERVLHLIKLLEQYPHLTITYDRDIIQGLALNCIECFPLKQCERQQGAVNVYMKFNLLNWDKVTPEQMEKTIFWLFFVIMMMPNHAAQLHGVVFQVDGEDCGPSNIKMAFEMFGLRLMSQCLPMRMKLFVTYNAPRFIRWFVWPPMKLSIPNKLLDRIFWVDDHDDVEKHFGSVDLHYTFGGPWRPNGSPSASDLAFVSQWTTDGRVFLPDEVNERMEKTQLGSDERFTAKGSADVSPRKVY